MLNKLYIDMNKFVNASFSGKSDFNFEITPLDDVDTIVSFMACHKYY